MINTIVWCLIAVTINPNEIGIVQTSAKGKVIEENTLSYSVDFSEYARQKGYIGLYYNYQVDKDQCIKEKDL